MGYHGEGMNIPNLGFSREILHFQVAKEYLNMQVRFLPLKILIQ